MEGEAAGDVFSQEERAAMESLREKVQAWIAEDPSVVEGTEARTYLEEETTLWRYAKVALAHSMCP